MDRRSTTVFHLLFSLAIVSVILGVGLLVITTGHVRASLALWPLALMILGVLYSYYAIISRWKAKTVFLGLFVFCAALIRFIAAVSSISVADYWPLYAIAFGICIIPSARIKHRRVSPKSIVLSSSFILLGIFFSIFSFGFSSMRFATFISRWWPALFIAAGLLLLIVWSFQRMLLGASPDERSTQPGGQP